MAYKFRTVSYRVLTPHWVEVIRLPFGLCSTCNLQAYKCTQESATFLGFKLEMMQWEWQFRIM